MDLDTLLEILAQKIPLTEITIGNILMAVLVIVIGYIIVAAISRYIRKAMLRANLSQILAEFTSRVIKVLLIIFVVSFAIGFLGIDVGAALVSISVVSGFVLGFAFQETLGNLAAGFMIAITKPFEKGDYVDIAGKEGVINSVGTSITKMTTVDNKRVIIPNSKIWGEPIVNYTVLKIRMIDMRIGIGYSDDMGKALKTTLNVLKKHTKVLNDPAPYVAIAELADSSVNVLARPWVDAGDYWKTKWELTQQIKDAYDKEGISIPFPQRDIHFFDHSK